ncbi:hypothetical protein AQUCO_10300001v1 [Aquilegia coerulea]|uniref:Arf-GAP domain-containing protein n=1 Tax=Aquilegia coerulea TaxID=218851 RepID=A0A2G5C528_AQUCA|nr:hypothetical protein AQUCO_10300001v1 [Aquilegia coerulea]
MRRLTSPKSLTPNTKRYWKGFLNFLRIESVLTAKASRGPRWASVNLGIFICMQCSGIHRSLGVHISKVRSATLDTWLPEQVAFIKSMGNEKSNVYWEAELPPNYDRVGIENFIRAKYEEKRWIPRDGRQKSPSKAYEERASVHRQRPGETGGRGYTNIVTHSSEERRNLPPPTKTGVPARTINVPAPTKVSNQVSADPKPAEVVKKPQPVVQVESTTQIANIPTPAPPPKVDYATDLFNMLSMSGPSENGSASSHDDNAWAGFQSAESASSTEKNSPTKPIEVESKTPSTSGIEDLFKDSPSVAQSAVADLSKKDVKNDIMSLFEKSKMVSPYSLHQQQMAMLVQQQSLLMAAATKSGGAPTVPVSAQQSGSNGGYALGGSLPNQNWPNFGYQVSGVRMAVPGQNEIHIQQMGNVRPSHSSGNSDSFSTASVYTMGTVAPVNGVATNSGVSRPSSTPITPAKSETDFDFSSLTQGMFSKS